jgi:hypothetical protein
MFDMFPSLKDVRFSFEQSFHDCHARVYGEALIFAYFVQYAKCKSCIEIMSFRSVEYDSEILLEDFLGRYSVLSPLLEVSTIAILLII